MPRVWTWLGVLALVAGAVGLADLLGGPLPASAQAGTSLTQPIPPTPDEDRVGSVRNQIGWTTAKKRWGWNMPMGKDIPVAQVEAQFNGGYIANTKDKQLPGTGFIPESGQTELSSHATMVARAAFGPDSAGQGVREVHAFEAMDWIGEGFLKTGTNDPPRTDHPARVFNNSWIAPGNASTWRILRRIDYLIDTEDIIVVAGVANKPGPAPDLVASAYNVISVGVASGNNSDGHTRVEVEGRCKPEIVAPGGKTSWTAGTITGCVAALLEVADRMAGVSKTEGLGEPAKGADPKNNRNKDAVRSEVIKAVLLGGAYKPDNWAPPEGEPLDAKLGAGIVDIDRSIVMLESGHVTPDTDTNQRYGWSFAQLMPNKQADYRFKIRRPQGETTIALNWHRRVLGGMKEVELAGEKREVWNSDQYFPNFELVLVKVDGRGNETEIAASRSVVDNVELIHVKSLDPGRYTIRVQRTEDPGPIPWDYAVAWRIEARE